MASAYQPAHTSRTRESRLISFTSTHHLRVVLTMRKKIFLRRNPKTVRAQVKFDEAIQKAVANGELIDADEIRAFEEKMYGDIWSKENYLSWMYENLTAIKSVMSDTGSIYVHLDWRIGHYVKILMDEVFGESNFRNN